jgi:hypothetical protein
MFDGIFAKMLIGKHKILQKELPLRNIIKLAILSFILASISGCGGGGWGKYYPPGIVTNANNTTKMILDDLSLGEENRKYITQGRMDENTFSIEGYKYYYKKHTVFNNIDLTIGIPINKWISITDQDGKLIKKLKTPRYTRDAVAIELKHDKSAPLLAILVDQQSTSHSSTLFVLNSNFDVIYIEHLLGAIWISKSKYNGGDILLVSTEKGYSIDGEWKSFGGNWKYDFFLTP